MPIGRRTRRYGSSWSKTTKGATPAIRCGAMDGDGRSTNRTRPTSRSRLTTKKIAWAATCPQKPRTGSTSAAIQPSAQSSQHKDTSDAEVEGRPPHPGRHDSRAEQCRQSKAAKLATCIVEKGKPLLTEVGVRAPR